MAYTPTEYLLVEHDGPVVTVTFNNPATLNSFNDEIHRGMAEIWGELEVDRSVRAVILTGAGKGFSSGGHIPSFIQDYEDPDHRTETLRHARRLMDAMAGFAKPVVAAVNGPAIGLGCSVAVSCDIVLMAESAYMADTHVNVGLVCGDGGAAAWPLFVSLLKAKEYLLLGDRIPAADAVALGLANRVVPDAELLTEAKAVAMRLAAQPVQAVQETKRALNIHLQHAIQMVAPFALAAEAESFGTEDVKRTIERFSRS